MHELFDGSDAQELDGGWISFDVAKPEGPEIVQQYLGKAVIEHENPPDWAFPTARWRGTKDEMATHWRYVEAPNVEPAAHIGQMAQHVRERLTAQLLKNVLAHAKELEEHLRYVEAYLDSAADSEDEAGLLMSAKPLLGDVRKFLRPNDLAKPPGAALCDRSA